MTSDARDVTLQTINNNIKKLDIKLNELKRDVLRDDLVINSHPYLFVLALIVFFVTMDFWSIAVHNTIRYFHPQGALKYWEYILIALTLLAVILWLGSKTGIRIRMLSETTI